MVRPSRRLLVASLVSLGTAVSAHADDADVINFRASVNALWDDNLFRTPEGSRTKPQAETITTSVLGVDFNKKLSLQQFIATVSWVDNRYARNSYLDAGLLHYDARWQWAVGSKLKGDVGIDRNAAQNSFADFTGLRQRNIRTTENQRFGLNYAVNPSWQVLGGVTRQTMTNEQLLAAESDFESVSGSAGLRYTPPSGNWITWQAKQTEGKYTKRAFDPAFPNRFDNEYSQSGQEILANWRFTGHSTVTGRLEYVRRKHAHFSDRDFSGWTGQGSYQYQYSEKTLLTATYLHNINAFQQESSSYYVNDDLIFASQWQATSKTSVGARVSFSKRRYEGALASYTGPQREDKLNRIGFDATYHPKTWMEIKGGASVEKRNSNLNGQDFTDRQVFFSVAVRF